MQEITSFLDRHEQAMFDLLKELVCLQSYSLNKAGVDAVGRVVEKSLSGLPLSCIRHSHKVYGDHLVFISPAAELARDTGKNTILITGHMDTVFPENSSFNWYRDEGDRIRGPGVIDMKGGLVVTIYAIKALHAAGVLADLPLILLFNSDEEIGSPSSTPLIQELAASCCCGLVTECGGMRGEVVVGRRGKRGYHLQVHGRAGHAAFAGPDKASAIIGLAHTVLAMEALNNPKTGTVVNVGTVRGGIGPNTVPESAEAEIDSRYTSEETGKILQEKLEEIAASTRVTGVSADLDVTHDRPLMKDTPANLELFHLFATVARELNIPLQSECRSGVSDANTLAGEKIPVLDGLGPIGEHDHSDREYMVTKSLPERTLLLARTLPEVAAHFCKYPPSRRAGTTKG